MHQLMVFCSFIIFFFSPMLSVAADIAPCTPVPFKKSENDIILLVTPAPKTSIVYFFKNQSNKSVFIEHPTGGKGASAGWSSFLRPNHWAAMVVNKKNFSLHCSTIEPGKLVIMDCTKTIYACTPKNLSTPSKLKGNYWLAEDKPWEAFVKALTNKKITFEGSSAAENLTTQTPH